MQYLKPRPVGRLPGHRKTSSLSRHGRGPSKRASGSWWSIVPGCSGSWWSRPPEACGIKIVGEAQNDNDFPRLVARTSFERHPSTSVVADRSRRPVRRCGSKGSVGSGISLLTRHFLKRVQNKLAVVLVGSAQETAELAEKLRILAIAAPSDLA